MITALLALLVLYVACVFITLSWVGGAALWAAILFALWAIHPFGNRTELGMALRAWRGALGVGGQ